MSYIDLLLLLAKYLTIPLLIIASLLFYVVFRSIIGMFSIGKSRLIQCPSCVHLVDETAISCKHCKTIIERPKPKENFIIRLLNYKLGKDPTHDEIKAFHQRNNWNGKL